MIGVGCNFTDFSDDLADLSHDQHGSFFNLVGTLRFAPWGRQVPRDEGVPAGVAAPPSQRYSSGTRTQRRRQAAVPNQVSW